MVLKVDSMFTQVAESYSYTGTVNTFSPLEKCEYCGKKTGQPYAKI